MFALGVVLGVVAHGCECCPARWRGCGGRCAPWMSFVVWLLVGVKFAGVVGDDVADVVRPDAVRVWLPMVCSCSDRGEGVSLSPA